MKSRKFVLGAGSIVALLCVCLFGVVGVSSSAPEKPESPPTGVNGLQGQLLMKFENLKPGFREAMTLELRNVSGLPISITDHPQFKAKLFDVKGHEISQSKFHIMSGPIALAQTAVIPGDAYLGFRVDMQTVGVPSKGSFLLALGSAAVSNIWYLSPGKYTLKSTMVMPKNKDNKNQWTGEINLPPVSFEVTKEQVAN